MGFFSTYHKNLIFVPVTDQSSEILHKAGADIYYNRTHKAVNNTLTHVMHLFEEKNKYPPVPVDGPLPIKANGAIVVNRPNQHTSTIRSLPLYLQDYESDDEDVYVSEKQANDNQGLSQEEEEEKEKEEGEEDEEYHTTTESSISNITGSDACAANAIHVVHEENQRLRQQILLEREQNEKYRLAKNHYEQELMLAKQCIKNLQRTTDRFQRLLSAGQVNLIPGTKKLRRQSTGAYFSDSMPLTRTASSPSSSAMAMSYEHKLQILLNEIEAMEQDEMESIKNMTIQKNECDKLMRKIKYRDDVIRQLAYDLQYQKSLVH